MECHPGEDNLMMKYISEHQMLAKHEPRHARCHIVGARWVCLKSCMERKVEAWLLGIECVFFFKRFALLLRQTQLLFCSPFFFETSQE